MKYAAGKLRAHLIILIKLSDIYQILTESPEGCAMWMADNNITSKIICFHGTKCKMYWRQIPYHKHQM